MQGIHDPVNAGDRVPIGHRLSRRQRLLLGMVAPFVAVALVFAADRALFTGCVLRGVWVRDAGVSGMNREELRHVLGQLESRIRQAPVAVSIRGRLFELIPEKVGLVLEKGRTSDAVLAVGRSGPLLRQIGGWFGQWGRRTAGSLALRLDRARLAQMLDRWQREAVEDLPFDGGVRLEQGHPMADYPRSGWAVDVGEAERLLIARLAGTRREVVDLVPRRRKPRLSRADVDHAVKRARQLLAGAVRLQSDAPELSLEASTHQLASALTSRAIYRDGKARLELGFDPEKVNQLLQPMRDAQLLEPLDATFRVDEKERVRVVPGRAGRRLDASEVAAALLRAAESSERRGRLPVQKGKLPGLSTEKAKSLGIRGLVTTFSTVHRCCEPRVKNIHRIAEILHGTVVLPGETLSVNEVVGPRTQKNGFVPAPTIEEGEMVDSVGGGISQFATTLFNAVLHGGYDIIERQPHTYYFDRYPMGHEATLSYPKPDLIFRNDTKAGLLIRTIARDTSITVKLYGDNGGRRVATYVSSPRDVVEPPVEYVADDTLDVDETKVVHHGRIGWSVLAVRRITTADGRSREEKRKVTYKPRVRIIRVHSCKIPEGEEGYTGEPCPEPEELEESEEGTEAGAQGASSAEEMGDGQVPLRAGSSTPHER